MLQNRKQEAIILTTVAHFSTATPTYYESVAQSSSRSYHFGDTCSYLMPQLIVRSLVLAQMGLSEFDNTVGVLGGSLEIV